eukprot:6187150-Pleurochrysis_carterae.AAC.1
MAIRLVAQDSLLLTDVVLKLCVFPPHRTRTSPDPSMPMTRRTIARSYARTWLVPDLLASLPLALFFPASSYRLSATVSLPHLLRLGHANAYRKAFTRVFPESTARLPRSVGWLAAFCTLCLIELHATACTLFLIAQLEAEACGRTADTPQDAYDGPNWAPPYAEDLECQTGTESWVTRDALGGAPLSKQYARAFYYTSTTLSTTGYGDLRPRSVAETTFQIFLTWLAAINCAVLVALCASMIAALEDTARGIAMQAHRRMINHMRARRLPASVVNRIGAYLSAQESTSLLVCKYTLLQRLPRWLRADVSVHLHGTQLRALPYLDDMPHGMCKELAAALQLSLLLPADFVVIEAGAPCRYAPRIGSEVGT